MSNRGDVFPSRNSLPGDSVAWGREVEERVKLAERDLGKVETRVLMQNRSSASQLQRLAEQVNDLTGRQTFYSDDLSYVEQWGAPTNIPNMLMVEPVSFTLTMPRVVEVSFVFQVVMQAQSNTSDSAFVSVTPGIGVDTTVLSSIPSGTVRVKTPPGTSYREGFYQAPVITRLVLTLPAGDHTVDAGLKSGLLSTTNLSNASPLLVLQSPQLFVNVMQPA